jgi:molybdopterin synthase catalytic subunit
MSKELFHISLTQNPLSFPTDTGNTRRGAHMAFSGVVRGIESEQPIDGIFYSAYEDMAGPLLDQIATEGKERFSTHGLWIEHRLGFVPAGEPSLNILVTTTHSAEAFEISRWYLHEIKTRLTVWKEPRFSDSEQSASINEK